MELQKKAKVIIDKLNLDELSMFGDAHLVGNAALGTTVKPDIDYQIYAKNDFSIIAEGVKDFLIGKNITDVAIRDLKTANKILVTGRIEFESIIWTIDVSITKKEDNSYLDDAYIFFVHFSPKFNDSNRKTIIKLKNYFLKKEMLWNGMSYYIYRAVLDHNAKTPADVFKYLSDNKVNISRFKKKGTK